MPTIHQRAYDLQPERFPVRLRAAGVRVYGPDAGIALGERASRSSIAPATAMQALSGSYARLPAVNDFSRPSSPERNQA